MITNSDASDPIRDYLTRAGWTQSTPGPSGALWRHNGAAVGVPEVVRYGSLEWRGVITRLAAHEERSPAEIAADIAGDPPLTCECCRSAPATHLLVADFPKAKRVKMLACGPCGRRDIGYGNSEAPTQVRLYMITEATDG